MGFPFRGPAPTTEDQVGILGNVIDWAGRLTGALNPVSATGAATKVLPGISRFATDAEALAGTQDLVGLSPLQLVQVLTSPGRMQVYRPASLTALNALAATATDGALAVTNNIVVGANGAALDIAVWMKLSGTWYFASTPYASRGTYALTLAGQLSALADLRTAINALPKLGIPSRSKIILDSAEFTSLSSAWTPTTGTTVPGFVNGYSQWDPDSTSGGWWARLERNGRTVTARLGIKASSTPRGYLALGEPMLSVPVGYRPVALVPVSGGTYTTGGAGWNGFAQAEARPNGEVTVNYASAGQNAVQGLFLSATWEAADL